MKSRFFCTILERLRLFVRVPVFCAFVGSHFRLRWAGRVVFCSRLQQSHSHVCTYLFDLPSSFAEGPRPKQGVPVPNHDGS